MKTTTSNTARILDLGIAYHEAMRKAEPHIKAAAEAREKLLKIARVGRYNDILVYEVGETTIHVRSHTRKAFKAIRFFRRNRE